MTLIIAFLLAVCLPLEPSLAKKPPKPDPPPVLYSIQLFEPPLGGQSLWVQDMNTARCVVGSYGYPETNTIHGLVCSSDIDVGQARDLNNRKPVLRWAAN